MKWKNLTDQLNENILSFLGNELLNGQTTNVNILSPLDMFFLTTVIFLDGSQTCQRSMEDIQTSIKHLGNSDILIICGGLGPFEDITRKAVAQTIGLETGFSEEVCQGLRAYMKSKGKRPAKTIIKSKLKL